jgi:signal transduction histidine kinase/DNA-binding response OmpR family regulator
MYIIYILLAAAAVAGLIRWTTDYLIRRNLRLEAIIADRTKIISEQAEKLRDLDAIKSRFFANISHEFRTPLTLTLGQIESAMESTSDTGLKTRLEMSFRNAKKLLKLVNQILEITKLESRMQKLRLARRDIVTFCRHLFYNFESYADNRGITLRFSSEDESLPVPFDAEKMEKVLVNLLGNAVKFTSSGGSIQLHISRIRSLSIDEKELVKISIKDNGIGIPADRLPYIFDRFYQVERTDRSELEGTGIGLSLVKELIELHGGSISVQSTEGAGSVFTVILPLHSAQPVPEELTAGTSPSFTGDIDIYASGSPFDAVQQMQDADRDLVLVVDDNSDIRQFVREQLEDSFAVLEAKDGQQGFAIARESIPNLIITDVRMPVMDGFILSKKLKEDSLTSHIPVIILTAKSEESDRLTGLETGADDYLVKPFSTRELLLRTKNLISGRKKIIEKFSRTASFNPSEVSASAIERRFLEKVQSEITAAISDESFSAEILASKCSVSVSQLNRKLKGIIGQPAGQLIRSARMEKAASLLKGGEFPIKEIAYMVGFSDQSTFTRAFSKYFGKAPGEYTQI